MSSLCGLPRDCSATAVYTSSQCSCLLLSLDHTSLLSGTLKCLHQLYHSWDGTHCFYHASQGWCLGKLKWQRLPHFICIDLWIFLFLLSFSIGLKIVTLPFLACSYGSGASCNAILQCQPPNSDNDSNLQDGTALQECLSNHSNHILCNQSSFVLTWCYYSIYWISLYWSFVPYYSLSSLCSEFCSLSFMCTRWRCSCN